MSAGDQVVAVSVLVNYIYMARSVVSVSQALRKGLTVQEIEA